MRGVGKDATALFDSVHAWVNYEQLLSKCLVGPLRNTVTINLNSSNSSSMKKTLSPPSDSRTATTPNNETKKLEITPRFDWIQKTADVVLTFYTKALCNPGLTVFSLTDTSYEIRIFIENVTHLFKIKFSADVRWPCTARLSNETGNLRKKNEININLNDHE